ncbi:MAG TPA: c-type cytochrome biogenesis protein CcsB [Micromonosporaceae bacterium]|nr:c-type cytochrome biogenesis protein CcsB [Micromonosporaceae bacterium]
MAELSRELLFGAIVAYVIAMMCYAAEFVIGVSAPGGALLGARVRDRELVGAGAPIAARSGADDPTPVSPPASGAKPAGIQWPGLSGEAAIGSSAHADRGLRWLPFYGRLAVVVTGIGTLLHASGLVTRGIAAGRVPWGNMYEFLIAVTLVCSIAWMVLAIRRPAIRPLGLVVTLVLVVLLGLDLIVLRTAVEPLVPALNSYWLKIHVTLAITASGLFMTGFCVAALYLIRTGYEKRAGDGRPVGFPYTLGPRLPVATNLERLTFRIHAFTFPIWTLAIMCGAIWAEAAWGRYWGWDPKETWSFIAWVVYAGYLHARATPSVKRNVATLLAVGGFAVMMVNLFVINFAVSGLHSYAGVG